MDDGAGHTPPSGAPGRAEDQQYNPWAAPPEAARGAGGKGAEVPPPIPPAPEGPGQQPYGHGGYGYGGHPAPPGPAGYAQQPGYGGYGAYGYGWSGPPLPAGLSIAAMVLGIVSAVLIVTCWGSFLSVITSIVALCLAVSARRKIARGELGGQGQATAGLVLGIIGIVGSVIISTLLILGLVWAEGEGVPDSDSDRESYNASASAAVLVMDH